MPRNICYYMCINKERIENDGGLHRSIVEKLKKKPTNAFKKISYAIFETPHEDFGFCVAHTNAIQQQKTLDKLEQEWYIRCYGTHNILYKQIGEKTNVN